MNYYFNKYQVSLILRNEIPEDKIKEEDKKEIKRLLKIYDSIKDYIFDELSNVKLLLKNSVLETRFKPNEKNLKINKNELYKNISEKLNVNVEDIYKVINIDDNLNINCKNCIGCKGCIECVSCKNCMNCELCFRCEDCRNTINRRSQTNLINDDSHFPLIVGETFTPYDPELDKELNE